MAIGSVVLGLVNIAIVVVAMLVLGLIIVWGCGAIGIAKPDAQLQKMYTILVGLIALYMLIALFFGLPTINVFR
jgi:hypothetical protein